MIVRIHTRVGSAKVADFVVGTVVIAETELVDYAVIVRIHTRVGSQTGSGTEIGVDTSVAVTGLEVPTAIEA